MVWEKIDEELKDRDWSVYRLTQEAGLAENYLYNLKSGMNKNPGFNQMCKIADALEISLDEFRKEGKNEKES